MKSLTPYSRIAVLVSALMLISAYYVPLWQILMWAPQYPEGLSMKIWINNITGDVKIISALNHYIGMKHIEVSMFPEFGYMIYIPGALIGLGLLTAIINKRSVLIAYLVVIVGCGLAALVDFYMWGYDYGHNLDPTAPIIVPGMSYQPPLIGTKQLLNFTAFSGPDIGGWIFMGAGVLAFAALFFEFYKARKLVGKPAIASAVLLSCFIITSCSIKPEPISYGKDACYHCKMTLMDNKFGAEVVSKKGKIFKFDDASCLVSFIHGEELAQDEFALCLITDFSSPELLIDAKTASYISSEELRSPMAGNVAAFKNRSDAEQFNKKWKGQELSWQELVNK